jgi:DNA-directed RNA polymerase specialized sigma24 family protein
MSPDEDITHWIGQLKQGDAQAAERVWELYFQKLVRLAARRLHGLSKRARDEEDVALSAFHSFYKRASDGQFSRLENRDDLWRLLVTITARKSSSFIKHQMAAKRGGGKTRGESVFHGSDDSPHPMGIDQIAAEEPSAEFADGVFNTCAELLNGLDDPLRQIALLKIEGYTNAEVAEQLGIATRSVTRKITLIRQKWEEAHPPEGD